MNVLSPRSSARWARRWGSTRLRSSMAYLPFYGAERLDELGTGLGGVDDVVDEEAACHGPGAVLLEHLGGGVAVVVLRRRLVGVEHAGRALEAHGAELDGRPHQRDH